MLICKNCKFFKFALKIFKIWLQVYNVTNWQGLTQSLFFESFLSRTVDGLQMNIQRHYLVPSWTSKTKLFVKINNGFQSLTIFAKRFILHVRLGSVDSSGLPDYVLGIHQTRRWWGCWCKFIGRNKVYGAFP